MTRKTLSVRIDAPKDNAEKRWKPGSEREQRLKERARDERRHMTEAERALWERLTGPQMTAGVKFSRKAVVGSTIVDFACSQRWLAVLLTPEGASPDVATLQDRKLADAGIRVLRFTEAEVLDDIEDVSRQISQTVNEPFERPASARSAAPSRKPRPAYARGPRQG